MSRRKRTGKKRTYAQKLLGVIMLFYFLAFITLFLSDYNYQALILSAAVPLLVFISARGLPRLFPGDRLLMSLTGFLTSLGVLILYRLSPERGIDQLVNYGFAVAAMLLCTAAVRLISDWRLPALALIPASLLLLALPLVFGSEINGARNWVTLMGFGFQPSEIVKLCLAVSLSWLLSRRKLVWSILLTGACLVMLMLQKDLGTALLYFAMAISVMYASTGSYLLLGAGVLSGAAASVIGYRMFAHVKKRIAVWRNPWADRQGSGYQIVQGLIAIANGGIWGTGLKLGNPGVIPASYNDYIFIVICHEFGGLFGLVVLGIYLAIIFRGISIARQASTSFHGMLALCCTVMLGIQTFVIVGGNIKLIPLTGVTLPFISYGGTSLVSSLCLIGLLQGVAARNRAELDEAKRLAMYEGEDEL